MNILSQTSDTDNELLILLRDNNQVAIKHIYDLYWKPLYLSAFNILKNSEQAEDIVQDVLLKLWIRKNEVEIKSLKAYLFKAVKNKVITHINSAGNRKVFIEDYELEKLAGIDVLINRLEQNEIKILLAEGINQLPGRCKEVFILSRTENLNNKQIAERMGISTKTVENQITIALKHLKISFGDYILFLCVFFFL
jgi:RNA polymerase sigma-70 factor (family 1)